MSDIPKSGRKQDILQKYRQSPVDQPVLVKDEFNPYKPSDYSSMLFMTNFYLCR